MVSDFTDCQVQQYEIIFNQYRVKFTLVKEVARNYLHHIGVQYSKHHVREIGILQQKEEELIANPNPFAIVVLANLYTLKTVNDLEKRLLFKEKVYAIAQL